MIDFSLVAVADPYTFSYTYGVTKTINAGIETVVSAGTTVTSSSIDADFLNSRTASIGRATLDTSYRDNRFAPFESTNVLTPLIGGGNLKLWEIPVKSSYQFWS